MTEYEIFDRAESCVIAYNENTMPGWMLRDYIRESLRAATVAAEQRGAQAERERITAILQHGVLCYQADGAVWFHVGALNELIDDLSALGEKP